MSATHDCGGDAAAYVLGALAPDEVEAFRTHMDGCIVCRDEVLSLRHVADALPMAAPQYPASRGLRRRVRAAVRAEAAGSEARALRGAGRPVAWWGAHRPALAGGLVAAVGAACAALVVALSSGSSGGTHVFPARVGYASVRVSSGHAELVVNRLPQPASRHIYEVWLQRGSQPPSPTKALFSVTSSGAADVDVPGNLHGVTQVLVTQEPAGGSPHPTTPAVIVAPIT